MNPNVCLLLAALATAACQTAPELAKPAPAARQEVELGEVQAVLKKLGYYRGGVDGIYGPMTRAAVSRSQADFGLPVTGEADPQLHDRATRHLLENPAHPDLPTTVEVFALQRGLGRLGYYDGPEDGVYLGDTLKALLRYRRANGLAITHKVDRRILRRIEREAAAVPASG